MKTCEAISHTQRDNSSLVDELKFYTKSTGGRKTLFIIKPF